MKYYYISGDGTGKTYGVYHGTSVFSKDLKLVVKGIKTFKQAQKVCDELKAKNEFGEP